MELREHGQKNDVLLIMSLLGLIAVGILLVYSATSDTTAPLMSRFWVKQIIYFCVGGVVAWIMAITNPRFFHQIAYPAYFISLLALTYVALGGGRSSHGAGRWIALGGFHLQPSEFAKIAYLLVLSRLLAHRTLSLNDLKGFIAPALLFIIPFLLILKQPDLSTALVFMVMTLASFYWSGLKLSEIFLIISPGLSVISTVEKWAFAALMVVVVGVLARLRLKLHLAIILLALNLSITCVPAGACSAKAPQESYK